ncbi:MAG: helix-turn-helix domain-containing protein [Bdellovibrionia bacterium]
MTQIDLFLVALKKTLKRKNIVYRDLAQKLDLSESSVKRILSSKSLTLERLEEICRACDIQFSEICSLADFNGGDVDLFYSDEQERALAQNARLFHFYILLEDGLSLGKILKVYDISESEAQKFLLQLDKLNLIELHPKNRVKVPHKGGRRFRKEGPMGKLLFDQARSSYLESSFQRNNEMLRFQMGYMSPATVAKLKNKIEKFLGELREDYVYEDSENPEVQTYGVLMAIRPWRYAWMDSLKKK